jgi:hypothetical protein
VTKPTSPSISGVAVLVLDVGRIRQRRNRRHRCKIAEYPLLAPARQVREVAREFQHNIVASPPAGRAPRRPSDLPS